MWRILKFPVSDWSRVIGAAVVLACAVVTALQAVAQDIPLISGGGGFQTSTTKGGKTSYIPTIQPLMAAPLGQHLLVESRATLFEDFFPRSGAQSGYNHLHFTALAYLQLDYVANSHLTVVAGEYLTPFGTYNERLTPIWIGNLQDVPLIFNLGVGTGSSVGGQVRGSVVSTHRFSVAYAAYYSAGSANQNFHSDHLWGGRTSIYLPEQRLELGASYTRMPNGVPTNNIGTHAWWEPGNSSFKLRSEYAHSSHSQGYWLETDYRLARFGGEDTPLGRLEPLFRWQQASRNSPDSKDGLPSADTERVDFGLDYHLPHEMRINTSYSRQFSITGNSNIWETGIVYHFLFPVWKGKE
jgi:hypothetical protein